jgi:transposase
MDIKDQIIEELRAEILLLREENRLLREELVELKRRLGLDSQTSSKPPSSDGLKKKIGRR